MCRIAIVGSRDFHDYKTLRQELVDFCFDIKYEGGFNGDWTPVYYNRYDDITIISGGARGADTLAEKFANEFGFKKIILKPDWDLYGKRAGFVRNAKIVDNCDILFAFQINKSKGTQHSINLAREKCKEVYVFEVEGESNGI